MKIKKIKQIISVVIVVAMMGLGVCGCGQTQAADISDEQTADAKEDATSGDDQAGDVSETDATETDNSASVDADTNSDDASSTDVDVASDDTATTTDKQNSSSTLTAQDFADGITVGWNLGNTLDAYSGAAGQLRNDGLSTEVCWGNPYTTKKLIDYVKGCGFNTIRIPTTWYTHMDPNTYEIDPEWMARVHEVVDYALDDNTYVILNVHHDTGTNGWLHASEKDLDKKKEILGAIWTQVASSFADYDNNLVFEGFNEILDDNNEWSNPEIKNVRIVNELNQVFVDSVRATGGENDDRVLIVNTYCAGNAKVMLNNFEIPTDTAEGAICAEVHAYTPYEFTAPEKPDVKNWSESDIDTVVKNVKLQFQLLKVPVIFGEFGCVDKNNTADRVKYVDYFVTTAKTNGIKCIWWDNGITKEFGIIDRNNLKNSQPEIVDAIIAAANK